MAELSDVPNVSGSSLRTDKLSCSELRSRHVSICVGCLKDGLKAQKEQGLDGVAVVVYFAVATGFAFTMFPVLLGLKDREESVYYKNTEM